jgi:hypothetical protein
VTGEEQAEEWKAPYISYQTLTTFIDGKLGQNPLPPRIDRGFVDNYAGSVQAQLLAALRIIGLVSDDGLVLGPLREAVRSPEHRQQVIRSWAVDFYQDQLALAEQNATAQMLLESFAKHQYSGSTLRKAIVFFLSLVDELGLPKSVHFKAPRQATPAPSGRRKKDAKADDPVVAIPTPQPAAGEQKTIPLGTAGEVTVYVAVKWLELSEDKFVRLRQAIRDLEELAEPAPGNEAAEDGTPVNDG